MKAMKSLMVIALATMASATYLNPELLRREIQARQATATATATAAAATATATVTAATNGSDACSSAVAGLATLISGLPTPTGALSSYLATAYSTLTDPCSLSLPTSITSAYSVYLTSILSFYSGHASQINSAVSACPSITSLVNNPVCSTAAGLGGSNGTATAAASATTTVTGTGTATATATITTTAAASGTAASTSHASAVSTAGVNQNPPKTGMVAVGLVAAGLFGAVAVAL